MDTYMECNQAVALIIPYLSHDMYWKRRIFDKKTEVLSIHNFKRKAN